MNDQRTCCSSACMLLSASSKQQHRRQAGATADSSSSSVMSSYRAGNSIHNSHDAQATARHCHCSSARTFPQVAKEDPSQLATDRLASGGATTAPPCAGCCQGSSSCPWHLPMALSLDLWGQDSFRFTCSKRASDTGRGSSFSNSSGSRGLDQQYPADAFTFASTVYTSPEPWEVPTMPGLLRLLSAPAAATPAGPARCCSAGNVEVVSD